MADTALVRDAAMRAIAEHLLEHGPQNWGAVRSKFPDVPEPTWWRWVKRVREGTPSPEALKKATQKIQRHLKKSPPTPEEVAAHLPAAPSPEYIARNGAAGLRQFDIMRELHVLFADALMLREFSLNNEGKVRIPMFFERSIKLRTDILETGLDAAREIWDLERIQSFHQAIVDAIREVSPEVAHAIVERMHAVSREHGWAPSPLV